MFGIPPIPAELLTGELAKHPHLIAGFTSHWGFPEFHEYVQSLMLIDSNERAGFPASSFKEILRLQEEHNRVFPQFRPIPQLTFY